MTKHKRHQEALKKQERLREEAKEIESAKQIAADIGLQANLDTGCKNCTLGLARIINDCGRNKGLVFYKCFGSGESVFRNCSEELVGEAEYKGKIYAVGTDGYVYIKE